ncbi:Fe-S cluster biosynthesis and repair protein YggX [Allopseudospirillum japonicum]|uniref:Probable Fe(2+)-trafficking protein n=1 Tax=Allopseudospirillum japonicum TaxID=64971 RepID=A0A1H6RH75_9GAMM|nr:oxidative damage protection protein [Allopseudospirillum japonicum]SEI52654.1 Fe-S cluster biosynthesis and repair protein YggX [Allopseudospirillum japonicum]
MSTLIFCRKYQRDLEALTHPPFPGPKGIEIQQSVSKQAWQAWLQHQTLLINEKRLRLADPETRTYLQEQMDKFFDNQEVEQADGYIAPEK